MLCIIGANVQIRGQASAQLSSRTSPATLTDSCLPRSILFMPIVSMIVNGKPVSGEVEGRTLLVDFLRQHLRLTGTHVGCDTSQCGCCTVHVDGKGMKSCSVLTLACEGSSITTIEGLATDGRLHPMQQAFHEHHGLQCGFCTPGMIMSALDMVNRKGNDLDEHTIREQLEGNLCRCTGYHNIVKAIQAGATAMKNGTSGTPAAGKATAEKRTSRTHTGND